MEPSGELLYFGVYLEKQVAAVSFQADINLAKVRLIGITNGVLHDEWAESVSGITHATEFGGKIFLINASPSNLPSVSVTVLDGVKPTTETYRLGLQKGAKTLCDVAGQYLICAQGKLLSVLNLKDGSIRNSQEELEITSMSTSGSGKNFKLS